MPLHSTVTSFSSQHVPFNHSAFFLFFFLVTRKYHISSAWAGKPFPFTMKRLRTRWSSWGVCTASLFPLRFGFVPKVEGQVQCSSRDEGWFAKASFFGILCGTKTVDWRTLDVLRFDFASKWGFIDRERARNELATNSCSSFELLCCDVM